MVVRYGSEECRGAKVVATTGVFYDFYRLSIPTLGHNLILWNLLRNCFSYLIGGNHVYIKDTQHAAQLLVLHGLFHENLVFLIESKPAFHTKSNAFSNSTFFIGGKPVFHTESGILKPNAFTKSALSTSSMVLSTSLIRPSTSLLTYSHWHKACGHVDTFARNKFFYKNGEILPNFIKYNS